MQQPAAAPAPQPQGQTPPPQVIVVQQPVPVGKPKSSRIKKVFIGCLAGVGALAIIGGVHGCDPGLLPGSGGGPVPVITQPAPTTAPTPPPPLSHVQPQIQSSALIGVHPNVGDQSWVDVSVTLTNMGNTPVQQATISLQQNGAALTITDDGGWTAIPNGVMFPTLGVGASQPVTLRVESWTPGVPIRVVVGGNGTSNSPTMRTVACPTAQTGENIGCGLNG